MSSDHDPGRIVEAFRRFCGAERFERFLKTLDHNGRHTARLRYWQQELWNEFAAAERFALPQDAREIAALFGLQIPERVLHWNQLRADEMYVLDLVQLPDGCRYLQPRSSSDARTPHTYVATVPALGRDLRNCVTASQHVKLENGTEFVVESHGIWMTGDEAAYFLYGRKRHEDVEWVNKMPPKLPPA